MAPARTNRKIPSGEKHKRKPWAQNISMGPFVKFVSTTRQRESPQASEAPLLGSLCPRFSFRPQSGGSEKAARDPEAIARPCQQVYNRCELLPIPMQRLDGRIPPVSGAFTKLGCVGGKLGSSSSGSIWLREHKTEDLYTHSKSVGSSVLCSQVEAAGTKQEPSQASS